MPTARRTVLLSGTSDVAVAVVLLLGVSVLLGWTAHIDALTRVAPGYVTMNPLTAVFFVASAVSLGLADRSRIQRNISHAIAALLLAVASWQLVADTMSARFQPDEVLFPVSIDVSVPLSRMAPSTALGFMLAAASLLFIQGEGTRNRAIAQYIAVGLGAIALFAAVAYAYGAGTLRAVSPFNLMAVHTSWGLFLLSIGLLFKEPRVGMMSLILSTGSAGRLLRLMIPAVVVVPAILGGISIRAAQVGFYGTALAVTMVATSSMVLLFILTIATAKMIQTKDKERQHLLDATRASEERLGGILSIAADAIISIDANQTITLFNTWAEKLFGYSCNEVLGKRIEILLPESLRAAHSAYVEDFGRGSTKARRMGERGNIFARRKDGTTFPAEASISKLNVDDQAIYTVVLRDMTEQYRADKALIQAKNDAEAAARSQSEFLANMSHEIRTPLNSITGFSQLLLGDEDLRGELRERTEKIRNAASALTTIVNDILDYSKLEEGMLTLSMMPLSPSQLVRNCVSIVTPAAEGRGLAIEVDLAEDVQDRFYRGDPHRVQQVLLNLLSNAVKFTENGSITVRVAEEDGEDDCASLRFDVTDTGIGISRDHMGRLFRRFSQVDGSVSRHYGGTGLGLAICKRIVNIMGGEIGVESEPGTGSTFWFRLPMERTAAPAAKREEHSEASNRKATQHSILLVEDIDLNREIAIAMLEKAGHAVDVACDGAEAVKKATHTHYDLILMDIQMPTMDGITATRLIRSLRGENGAVPIVAMTANVLPDDVDRFHQAGMNGHIRKPVEHEELIAQVDHWTSGGKQAVA
jgi:PAS domain S-box-containing protein